MGIAETVTVVFVVLKLIGHIDWAWFWCISPMIFTYGGVLAIGLLGLFAYSLGCWWVDRKGKVSDASR